MSKASKAATIPVTPKTSNPASVFSWLSKHFNVTKHAFQSDSNPFSNRSYKTGDIPAADRRLLVAWLAANPDVWELADDGTSYHWKQGGVRINLAKYADPAYSKYFSFTCPKAAKASTISYYD